MGVETDLADSVLARDFANGELPYFSKSKSQDQGLSTLTLLFSSSLISSCFQHSSYRINSTAAFRIYRNIHFGTDAPEAWMGLFRTIVRENLANCANRRGFLLIRAQFALYSTLTNCSITKHVIALAQYRGDTGRIQQNPANIRSCFFSVS